MTFDLLATIGLTASAAVVVATYVALVGSSLTQRVTIGAAMALWFIGVLWIGVPGNLSTPLLGAAVLIPVAVFSVIGFGSFASRSWLQSAPLPALIALHAIRLLGVLFVLLYAAKRLPAPFAPVAGWGDIIIGSTALPIALWVEVLQLCRSALISLADMVLAPSVAGLFKWRQFEPEMILLAVGWYLRFSLSYRDVEELLAERGLLVDHVTVWRWVQRYAPEIQRRLRPQLRPTNDSWRVG